jgi:3-deoxy-manno-octulosonate cytidylyltransferase (CMP-KDO synthetase)
MSIIAIIPARMSSSRFPGKPMKKILNKPMIGHVYERVKNMNLFSDVIVATCDTEISNYIHSINGKAIMTKKTHNRAVDRCAEALYKYQKKTKKKVDSIIMIQGDEPLVNKKMVNIVFGNMKRKKYDCINLYSEIDTKKDFLNEDVIKVIINNKKNCILMSRNPIPYLKKFDPKVTKKQVCVIGFTTNILKKFYKLKSTFLEKTESIDMLRFIDNSIEIKMIHTKSKSWAVDRPRDIKIIEKLMKKKNV